jgi:hypothetical protein
MQIKLYYKLSTLHVVTVLVSGCYLQIHILQSEYYVNYLRSNGRGGGTEEKIGYLANEQVFPAYCMAEKHLKPQNFTTSDKLQ